MKRVITLLTLSTLLFNTNSFAQQREFENDYTQLEGGLDYKITKRGEGKIKPVTGDYIELFITLKVDDSVIFDTRQAMESDQPAPMQLARSSFKGDLVNVLALMHAGDEAIARISIDSMVKAGVPTAPWMRLNQNQKMVYDVKMVTVKPAAVKAQEDKEAAVVQAEKDEKLIKEYLANNKIEAKKTATGLYYIIEREGTGENARQGQKVFVNYTGMLLDGMVFDSNVDPAFGHVEPFSFQLGRGSVIKGWDEGLGLMKKGTKGKLFIPSSLAYGTRPNGKIPANAVLVFDVELLEIESMDVKEETGMLEAREMTKEEFEKYKEGK